MIGMQFFANRLRFDENGFRVRPGTPGYDDAEVPRSHFDTLLWAFTTIFQVLSGENWNDVFSDSLDLGSPLLSVCYFVPLFIMGNYVLVNLFVAIICWGWDSAAPTPQDLFGGQHFLLRRDS